MLNPTDLTHRSMTAAPAGLTIVIPNWNHEFLLPRSITSALTAVRALAEHDVPADVLVIDDHSRDGSLTLLRQLEALYFEDGLRVRALKANIGVTAVRNLALIQARYRYLLFMDADNELVSENVHLFYRSIVDTEAAMVYGNLIWRMIDGRYRDVINNESFQNHIFQQNYIDTFALYDRLQIFDAGGYQETPSMEGHEDWELILHLAASGRRMVFVPVILGIYNDLPTSRVEGAKTDEHFAARAAYIQRVFDQIGIREQQIPNTHHLRYHPDIGYI